MESEGIVPSPFIIPRLHLLQESDSSYSFENPHYNIILAT